MTDTRKMLEDAARAAGIAITPCTCTDPRWPFRHDESKSGKSGHWNPLEHDGDCARLEAACEINVMWWDDRVSVVSTGEHCHSSDMQFSDHGGDRSAARRHASVRAAAQIGAAVREKNDG